MNLPPLHSLRLCEPSCARQAASTGSSVELADGILCGYCGEDLKNDAFGNPVAEGLPNPWAFACENHHIFHKTCMDEIRNYAVTHQEPPKCPDCRSPLLYGAPAPPQQPPIHVPAPVPVVPAAPPPPPTPNQLLDTAIRNERVDNIRLAIQNGANPNQIWALVEILEIDHISQTRALGLMRVVFEACAALVPPLIVDLDQWDGWYKRSPLMICAKRGWLNCVKALIEYNVTDGASINQSNLIDANGRTALYYAVLHNRANVVELLCGAQDVGVDSPAGDPGFRITEAQYQAVYEINRQMLGHTFYNNALPPAAGDVRRRSAMSLVQIAAERERHTQTLIFLLRAADRAREEYDRADIRSDEALVGASMRGHERNVMALLDMGVRVRAVPSDKAFAEATTHDKVRVMSVLLDFGALPMGRTRPFNRTPLHHACKAQAAGAATFLLERVAGNGMTMPTRQEMLEASDYNGDTPLLLLVKNGRSIQYRDQGAINILRMLLRMGANVCHKNNVGMGIIGYAEINGIDAWLRGQLQIFRPDIDLQADPRLLCRPPASAEAEPSLRRDRSESAESPPSAQRQRIESSAADV